MAIAGGSGTAADYKTVVDKIFYYIDHNFGGIDKNGFPVYAQINRADFDQLLADYFVYKQTRDGRPSVVELHAGAHGVNNTVYATGGEESVPSAPEVHF